MARRFSIILLLVVAAGLAGPVSAHEYKLKNLEIIHPWARASIGHARAGAAYVVISNEGDEVDRLVAVTSNVAKHVALHTHKMDGDVMKMMPVKAIELAPGAPVALEPGGLHIMLMGLKGPLVEGKTFPLTLTFEKSGSIEVEVHIQKPVDMKPHDHKHKSERRLQSKSS